MFINEVLQLSLVAMTSLDGLVKLAVMVFTSAVTVLLDMLVLLHIFLDKRSRLMPVIIAGMISLTTGTLGTVWAARIERFPWFPWILFPASAILVGSFTLAAGLHLRRGGRSW